MMDVTLAPVLGDHTMQIEQSTINDYVGSLDESSISTRPDCSRKDYRHYSRWTSKFTTSRTVPSNECHTRPSSQIGNPCIGHFFLSISSLLLTTQTSSHSIEWKQMLLDEGSIVGGITFLTWFLGIFII
jgi:hypothetical protein